MDRSLAGRLLAAAAVVFFSSATLARASLVVEAETNGSATNNTLGAAQAIPDAAFTTPPPPGVYNPPPGYFTATITGRGGPDETDLLAGSDDVDFYKFSSLGGTVFFDIDDNPYTFDPVLSLFDSAGTLLAYDDDSSPADEGSESGLDSFLGVYTLPGAGTYYIAVSTFANFATARFSGSSFSTLTRPDGEIGGTAVTGATPGDSTFSANGAQELDSAPYTLHISLQQPGEVVVPEPASLTLWGLAALGCAIGAYRRRK